MADKKIYVIQREKPVRRSKSYYKTDISTLNAIDKREAIRELRKEQGLDDKKSVKRFAGGIGLGKLVVLVLMIALLFRVLQGGDMPTFASLLERLRTMPTIVPVEIFNWQVDLGDWGIFNFLKDIFESSIANVGMLFGMISSLINCIPFVFTLVTWIFAG